MSPINSVRALLPTSYYVQNFSRSSTLYYGNYPDSNYKSSIALHDNKKRSKIM